MDQVLLSIETPNAPAQTYMVPSTGEISIGRDETCTVVLASPDISRRHVTITVQSAGIAVRDSSSNGTQVGTQRVFRTEANVAFGTGIQVGPYLIRVVRQGAAAAPPMPPGGPPPGLPSIPGRGGGGNMATMAPGANVGSLPGLDRAGAEAMRATMAPGQFANGQGRARAAVGGASGTMHVPVELRRKIHRMLLDNLDLAVLDRGKMADGVMRPKVKAALKLILGQVQGEVPPNTNTDKLMQEISDEALGLGPLEQFLGDALISEIMVVDPQSIYIERRGKLEKVEARFTDDEAVRSCIERIVTPLGRRIDESTPLVDARLKDGSRVNAVIRPLAIKGACITIRKFAKTPLTLQNLISFGAITDQMARFLTRTVVCKKNIVISGGTGSGKTTLLNVLSAAIPSEERIITIEDAAELQMGQPHVVSLESRPANMEGKGEYTIRDLVRNALRMRPDRIVVGECRGGECLDMLQAMNTGHDGSLTTTHANSPREAINRLEVLALMSGIDLPARAIREQIANSVHIVVQQSRFADGSRRVTAITEITGLDDNFEVQLRPIFEWVRTGTGEGGKILGEYRATGYLPSFLDQFIAYGLVQGRDYL
ncbi:MAG: Flp pilus assembly complex ATPase component TadA [Deltaproteobacteria bacterium]|nr:Flp pilus assembly complex ATPase component TadA [Deltaproteobacteria bacterium]